MLVLALTGLPQGPGRMQSVLRARDPGTESHFP